MKVSYLCLLQNYLLEIIVSKLLSPKLFLENLVFQNQYYVRGFFPTVHPWLHHFEDKTQQIY